MASLPHTIIILDSEDDSFFVDETSSPDDAASYFADSEPDEEEDVDITGDDMQVDPVVSDDEPDAPAGEAQGDSMGDADVAPMVAGPLVEVPVTEESPVEAPLMEEPRVEAPAAEERLPSFRPYRPFPGGARLMCTPRKRVTRPQPLEPAMPAQPAPVAESSEPPRKKLLRRSQARRRTYLPTVAGYLAYSDESSDDDIFMTADGDETSQPPADFPFFGGLASIPIRRTLYSVRGLIGTHDTLIQELHDKTKELETDAQCEGQTRAAILQHFTSLEERLGEAERGRMEAERGRDEAWRRIGVLERRVDEMDRKMQAAVAALAAVFPSSSQ